MRIRAAILALVFALFAPMSVGAEMSSSNYIIRWDTISTGGGDTGSSASFLLRDSVGGVAPAGGSSSNYDGSAGYRAGVNDQVVSFSGAVQNLSTEIAATSLVGTTISVADTSGFSVGDTAIIVQDKGASQVAGFGRVTSIGSGTLILDYIADNGTAPTIDGTNDYAYVAEGTTISLGTLSTSAVSTAIIVFGTTADIDGGYTIQAVADGLLRDGANTIDNVSDGAVTAGSEEHGARSSDTSIAGSTFDTADTAITTTFQTVVDRTENAFDDRTFLTLKTAISSSTTGGSYGRSLTFIMSGNY